MQCMKDSIDSAYGYLVGLVVSLIENVGTITDFARES